MNSIAPAGPLQRIRIRRSADSGREAGDYGPLALRSFGSKLAFALALLAFGKATKFAAKFGLSVDRLSLVQYLVMAIACGYLLSRSGSRIKGIVLLMPIAALAGTILSEVPEAALLRWGGWALLYAIGVPLFGGAGAREFRDALWKSFVRLAMGIAVLSFPLYFIHILPGGRGFFSGVMLHSMLLAPIAGLSTVALLARYLHSRRRLHLALFMISLATVVFCGSRGSLLGTLCAIGYFLWIADRRTRLTLLPIVLLIGCAGGGIYLYRASLTSTDVGKYYFVTKGTRNTRASLWESRLSEASEHFLLGEGIGMTAENTDDENVDVGIGSREMRVEPGSSWIAMISMTGLAGVFGFLLMAGPILARVARQPGRVAGLARQEAYGALAFFLVHATFEGYIFAVGSPLAVVFWLCWGRLDDLHHQ